MKNILFSKWVIMYATEEKFLSFMNNMWFAVLLIIINYKTCFYTEKISHERIFKLFWRQGEFIYINHEISVWNFTRSTLKIELPYFSACAYFVVFCKDYASLLKILLSECMLHYENFGDLDKNLIIWTYSYFYVSQFLEYVFFITIIVYLYY